MQTLAESGAGNHDTSPAQLPGAARLTFDGKVTIGWATQYPHRTLRLPSLAGASVRVVVPQGWVAHSVSASVRFERQGVPAGFQRHPRGSALTQLVLDADRVHPDSVVSMHGGLLAHYRLDFGPAASTGFTLWQGPRSDVFSAAYETFEQALDGFSQFVPSETEAGAVLEPPAGWSVARDELTIDCGGAVVDLSRRTAANAPPWGGASAGDGVELFHVDDGDGVLAVGPSATATVGRAPRPGHAPVTDADLIELAQGLRVDWVAVGAAAPAVRSAV